MTTIPTVINLSSIPIIAQINIVAILSISVVFFLILLILPFNYTLLEKIFMKAIMKVARGMGNVELRDIPEPTPQANEVMIKIQAAGICGTDIHIFKDEFPTKPPVVLGHEISGEIVEIGCSMLMVSTLVHG